MNIWVVYKFGAITNTAGIKLLVHTLWLNYVLIYVEYITRSWIAALQGMDKLSFNNYC